MSKTETLRQLSDVKNSQRVEYLANQITAMKQAKYKSAEDLAAMLEPLAQALAALTDETRQTLAEIDRKSREQGETFRRQLSASVENYNTATTAAARAAESMNKAAQRMGWRHYALALLTGLVTAALVSGFWLWLAPPTVQNQLDARAVAEHLMPAVTEALKPSRGK